MKLRSVTLWRTRSGKRRRIRLYTAWQNLRGRASGRLKSERAGPIWLGLPIEFRDWAHFRAWSLENGYSKLYCSLDRIDSSRGYAPDNCRWLTRSENSRWVHGIDPPLHPHYCPARVRSLPNDGAPGPDVPF